MDGLNRIVTAVIRDEQGETTNVEDGALAVALQDQHSEILGRSFSRQTGGPFTLASPTVQDSYTVELAPGHGLIVGDVLQMMTVDREYMARVVGVAGDTISLNTPVPFSSASAVVTKVSIQMNVNGSVTPVVYSIGVGADASYKLDVKGVRFCMTSTSEMDDSKFGSVAELARGVALTTYYASGSQYLHWAARSNQCLQLKIDHLVYSIKAKQGEYGLIADWILDTCGVVIRLGPGDTTKCLIQDDLTGLASFRAWMYGHVVRD